FQFILLISISKAFLSSSVIISRKSTILPVLKVYPVRNFCSTTYVSPIRRYSRLQNGFFPRSAPMWSSAGPRYLSLIWCIALSTVSEPIGEKEGVLITFSNGYFIAHYK
ncbi:hypothetical protein PMAYCL1PPCAC_30621, partial [Pristionchus mayeri]